MAIHLVLIEVWVLFDAILFLCQIAFPDESFASWLPFLSVLERELKIRLFLRDLIESPLLKSLRLLLLAHRFVVASLHCTSLVLCPVCLTTVSFRLNNYCFKY